MIEWIPWAIGGAAMMALVISTRVQKKRFVASMKDDDVVYPRAAFVGPPMLIHRHHPPATAAAVGGGKRGPILWLVVVEDGNPLAKRSTLEVTTEGFFSSMGNALGAIDIVVGDETFDDRFRIRGSDDDVIRGVFTHAAIKKTLASMFRNDATAVRIDHAGTITATFKRKGLVGADGKEKMQRCLEFARVARTAADLPARPAPADKISPTALGASSSMGGSVAIPSIIGDSESR